MHLPILTDSMLIVLAREAGAHALAWFVILFLLLQVEVGLLAWAARRFSQWRMDGRAHAFDRPSLERGLELAVILSACLAFCAIAYEVAVGGTFVRVDQAFSAAVRDSTSERTLQVFAWITHLGDGSLLAVLCLSAALLLLRRGERLLAIGLVVAIGGNGLLNAVLKRVFERVRPPPEHGLPIFHGWGFPSGHASGALVAYGILAYVLMRALPRVWHFPVLLLAAAAAFLVGGSRIFLEAHFAGDVVAGFASGTAWLVACILGLERLRGRPRPVPSGVAPALDAAVYPTLRL